MAKLTGLKKKRTAVFISGAGSNLKNLIKFSIIKKTPVSINLVISSTNKAKGLRFADQFNIKKKIFNFRNIKNTERNILNILKKERINFICLAGFMRILSKYFIKKFDGKIINIHPSLLPKYKGLDTFKRVLKSKEKITGCTVHHVNAKLDSGQNILQKKISVNLNDNEKSLKKRVQQAEYKAYPEAVIKLFR